MNDPHASRPVSGAPAAAAAAEGGTPASAQVSTPAPPEAASAGVPARAAVVGAGTIGLSWARLFAAAGTAVTVFDPRDDLAEVLAALTADAGLPEGALTRASTAAEAVDGVEFVQESGPEEPHAKAALFAQLAEAAPEDALLLSSSSAIPASRFAADLPEAAAARVLVGHPFNPPHIMPLVEVVPGERTAAEAVERAVQMYRSYGRAPIVLKQEVRGFVGNRLQNAVLREAVHLVQSGVVDAADLDTAVKNSLGLRWAAVGPLEGLHLGGGAQGLRGLMEHIGPSFAAIDLHEPDMSAEGMEPVFAQTEAAYGMPPRAEIAAERDRFQEGVLRLRGEPQEG
ncbi:3-hydroxyacyl-CoA dehydrogenase NAD-binding domain-containing protein [Brevibacterium sp.]|uniref:3-hydroxyacyl-CoA dehydrogenase NAD-binding domain-containing protein n=1 Tax=Brevibacterium sp. TaxID=1701 RepID=UPI0025B7DDD7|nr:3-hydroxyacyl-CoA dehydrogenase NAD-binding domain-containing protein [Brevibacterium sp.]